MQKLTGKMIANRYRVDSYLGSGGMADVYKVFDVQRSVHLAMKVMHPDLAEDVVFLKRFRREAHTLETLSHPNIVRFFGLEQSDELAFMLMGFVDGATLSRRIALQNGKPMPPAQILEIMRPVCAALYYAHQMNMVHCDVKPANIMIQNDGRVLLADFGIARQAEGATTATMVGVGTPAYMSPEQIAGLDPTAHTDIYALGIMLYELVTGGQRPFTGHRATVTGPTGEKLRWEHLNLDPEPPSQLNPGLAPAFEQAILKCLAKKPEGRFQTTLELLAALEGNGAGRAGDRETGRGGDPESPRPVVGKIVGALGTPAKKPAAKKEQPVKTAVMAGGIGILVLVGIVLCGVMGFFIYSGVQGRGALAFLAADTATPTPSPIPTHTPTNPSTETPEASKTPAATQTTASVPTGTRQPTVQADLSGVWIVSMRVTEILEGQDKIDRGETCPWVDTVEFTLELIQDAQGRVTGSTTFPSVSYLSASSNELDGEIEGSAFTLQSITTSGECLGSMVLFQGTLSGPDSLRGSKIELRLAQGDCCIFVGEFTGTR